MKKRYFFFLILIGLIIFILPGFKQTVKDILILNRDTTVSPRKDFFLYANGEWIKKNPIPASESNWGIGNLVEEDIKQKLKELNENSARLGGANGSDAQKIGDFFKSGMDSVQIEKEGMSPILPYLQKIESVRNLSELWSTAAEFRTLGMGSFFGLYIAQDDKISDKIAIQIHQGGLGLPNRDYYLKTDKRTKNIQVHYNAYILDLVHKLCKGLNLDSAGSGQTSQKIYAFEKKLAENSKALQDLRDPIANYHKMTLGQLQSLSPNLNWTQYFQICGLKGVDTLIVGQPDFIKKMASLMDSIPLRDLKSYLEIQSLNAYAPYLSKNFSEANFLFYGKILRGQTEMKPRWKRVVDVEEGSMGMLLGRLFIHSYFSDEAKRRYNIMVDNVLAAFETRIQNLTWMSAETKAKALIKLHTVNKKVGYPDRWKDYSDLSIQPDSYFKNVMNARVWAFKDRISKFGKPVNRMEWGMTPQTYNAYYNPSNNEIVLPAAQFMVPGMKDEELDDAIAYGYTAASTIGHEITHGFDDEGRQFNEKGNLKDWWTPSDAQKFNERAQKMVDQFNAIVVLDSLHINGKACLGENIADLGGILIGLDAFKKTEQYKSHKKLNGLSPEQRFFLGYALGWLGHEKDQSLANQILTDVHAPGKYRVNAPMQNVPDFYTAFGIKPGDPMYREEKDRVKIW
jgi:putative endopeptidase